MQQEIAKGGQNGAAGTAFHELNGGWQFNRGWFIGGVVANIRRPLAMSAKIKDEQLKSKPFHRRFLDARLHDPTKGSQAAGLLSVKYKVLATGIPAMSYAIATNSVNKLNPEQGENRNFNMQGDLKSERGKKAWPVKFKKRPADWLHSDFKDVALHFVYPMYEKMITLAKLDEE